VNSFDGTDDYIDCGTGTSLDILGDYSASFWIKPTELLGYEHELFSRGLHDADGFRAFLGTGGRVFLEFSKAAAHQFHYSADGIISINTWYHIVLTRANQVGIFYINGTSIAVTSEATADTPLTSARLLKIGINDGLGNPYEGLLGLFRIFNRALSAPEPASIYQSERHLFNI
jgi:hypothetical protein